MGGGGSGGGGGGGWGGVGGGGGRGKGHSKRKLGLDRGGTENSDRRNLIVLVIEYLQIRSVSLFGGLDMRGLLRGTSCSPFRGLACFTRCGMLGTLNCPEVS